MVHARFSVKYVKNHGVELICSANIETSKSPCSAEFAKRGAKSAIQKIKVEEIIDFAGKSEHFNMLIDEDWLAAVPCRANRSIRHLPSIGY